MKNVAAINDKVSKQNHWHEWNDKTRGYMIRSLNVVENSTMPTRVKNF